MIYTFENAVFQTRYMCLSLLWWHELHAEMLFALSPTLTLWHSTIAGIIMTNLFIQYLDRCVLYISLSDKTIKLIIHTDETRTI